ncbi:MAG: alpha/beta hydrolase-fold protein [Gammaproteobacteria bacterium]|nr:alpha/beta hydrolase-fold protein [Gammaproteobacteria bacterium]
MRWPDLAASAEHEGGQMDIRILLACFLLMATTPSAAQVSPQPLPKASSGSIERLADFPSRFVPARNIDVWLPEGYGAGKRYNVIYMHDGQMLFDADTTWNKQAWNIDDTVARLMREGRIPDTIVVGIWNRADYRYAEYYPKKYLAYTDKASRKHYVQAAQRGKSLSDNYLRFIVRELKPAIDRRYATRPGPESTFMIGSSMGGLISLYALFEYPKVFGGAAGLSTHWIGNPTAWGLDKARNGALPLAAMTYLQRNLPPPGALKVYSDRGDDPLDSLYAPAHGFLAELLRDGGYHDEQVMLRVYPGRGHNEKDWAARVEAPLLFLMGRKPGA